MSQAQSQSLMPALSLLTFVLVAFLPISLSAFRLDSVRRDTPEVYNTAGTVFDRLDTQDEWRRSIPKLVRLLRSIYAWERQMPALEKESSQPKASSSFRPSSSQGDSALFDMLASLSQSLRDVKPAKMTSQQDGVELTSTDGDAARDEDQEAALMTSKRTIGDVRGAMAPLNEFCLMVGLKHCNRK